MWGNNKRLDKIEREIAELKESISTKGMNPVLVLLATMIINVATSTVISQQTTDSVVEESPPLAFKILQEYTQMYNPSLKYKIRDYPILDSNIFRGN